MVLGPRPPPGPPGLLTPPAPPGFPTPPAPPGFPTPPTPPTPPGFPTPPTPPTPPGRPAPPAPPGPRPPNLSAVRRSPYGAFPRCSAWCCQLLPWPRLMLLAW